MFDTLLFDTLIESSVVELCFCFDGSNILVSCLFTFLLIKWWTVKKTKISTQLVRDRSKTKNHLESLDTNRINPKEYQSKTWSIGSIELFFFKNKNHLELLKPVSIWWGWAIGCVNPLPENHFRFVQFISTSFSSQNCGIKDNHQHEPASEHNNISEWTNEWNRDLYHSVGARRLLYRSQISYCVKAGFINHSSDVRQISNLTRIYFFRKLQSDICLALWEYL